ncbi:hypothetical protein PV761_03420 [Arthrobacter sp. CC3]|uniref:hypothetical protein n=1 Tax=Arthrobacter sp. CC3 TaxID=3029185 RepID=UPI0032654243
MSAQTEEQTDEIVQVDIKAENLRFAFKKAVMDSLTAEIKKDREEHLKPLVEEWRRSGNKSFSVTLPDGTKIGSVTLTEGTDATVIADDTAYFMWMKANHPEEIETITEPEQVVVIPAKTYEQVKPAALNRLLELEEFGQAGDDIITKDGEKVPGVEYLKAPEPSQFSVTYVGAKAADKDKTKAKLFAAYRAGQLGHLNLGPALPQIEA